MSHLFSFASKFQQTFQNRQKGNGGFKRGQENNSGRGNWATGGGSSRYKYRAQQGSSAAAQVGSHAASAERTTTKDDYDWNSFQPGKASAKDFSNMRRQIIKDTNERFSGSKGMHTLIARAWAPNGQRMLLPAMPPALGPRPTDQEKTERNALVNQCIKNREAYYTSHFELANFIIQKTGFDKPSWNSLATREPNYQQVMTAAQLDAYDVYDLVENTVASQQGNQRLQKEAIERQLINMRQGQDEPDEAYLERFEELEKRAQGVQIIRTAREQVIKFVEGLNSHHNSFKEKVLEAELNLMQLPQAIVDQAIPVNVITAYRVAADLRKRKESLNRAGEDKFAKVLTLAIETRDTSPNKRSWGKQTQGGSDGDNRGGNRQRPKFDGNCDWCGKKGHYMMPNKEGKGGCYDYKPFSDHTLFKGKSRDEMLTLKKSLGDEALKKLLK
jgi:hypothetical protein